MRYGRFLLTCLILGYAFLYIPIALLVATSFNPSRLTTILTGFSLQWYATLWHDDKLVAAALLSLRIAALSATGVAQTMRLLIEGGADALARARDAIGDAPKIDAGAVTLLAPIPDPSKVLCSGINYRGHAAENPNAVMPEEPFFFAKLPSSGIGPDAPIPYPPRTRQLDYEVQFAVVIGRRLSRAAV